MAVILATACFMWSGWWCPYTRRFDADVSGDVIAAQQAIIGEAGKGKIAGSVVTERPLLADNVEKVLFSC